MLSTFSKRLSEAIADRGVSASDVAKAARVDRGYISLLRSGSRKNPSKEVVENIAQFLAVPVDWLLSGAGEMGGGRVREESADDYVFRRADDFWERKAVELAGPWLLFKGAVNTLKDFADSIARDPNLSIDERMELLAVLKKEIGNREVLISGKDLRPRQIQIQAGANTTMQSQIQKPK